MAVSGVRSLFGRFFDTAFGYAVGGAASSAIEPLILPLTLEAWAEAVAAGDSRVLSPVELAQMVVQGVLDEPSAAAEAAKSGYDAARFHQLVRLSGEPPGPETLLDMWDRGVIAEADVDRGLLQSRLKPEWVDSYKKLANPILQVEALAEMVVQGVFTEPEGAQNAALLGWSAADFHRLVRLAGNPPGPQEMLSMWNRGIATEADVDKGLLQSRLKPEWVDQFKQLREHPASVAAAVSAVIKERITVEQGHAIALQNGITTATFDMLVDEGGRPISITEALQLIRRGEFTDAQFNEVVARSDVKTMYAPDLLKLREVLPSLAQMRAVIGTGALPDSVAKDVLTRLGLAPDIVAGVIAAGHGEKLAGSKALTQTAVLEAYQTEQVSAADATTMLGGLGYDANDAKLLLAYTDYQRAHTYRTAVIAVVKARYLANDIDEGTASSTLDQIGMLPAERDQYLQLWTFDIQANPHLLTLAQLNAMVKKGILDAGQYAAYLPRLGYVDPELSLLVQLYASG